MYVDMVCIYNTGSKPSQCSGEQGTKIHNLRLVLLLPGPKKIYRVVLKLGGLKFSGLLYNTGSKMTYCSQQGQNLLQGSHFFRADKIS